uniref:Uncharacterized protein n=1 Tax=Erpetoichthys calabaricus TaxID=27687 RepID=A0A8C4RW98_ERPCA
RRKVGRFSETFGKFIHWSDSASYLSQHVKTCNAGWWTFTRILIPYHLAKRPFAILELKHRPFPGRIFETVEIIPPLPEGECHL